jgi:uncharacterized membrane protein YphA (DoxX/SURF4 family)
LLRIAIGWHYFYEGIHKFDPIEEFSAEGFLGVAKGPTADFYYAMLPDFDGFARLEIADVDVLGDDGKTVQKGGKKVQTKTFIVYEKAWQSYFDNFMQTHGLDQPEAAESKKLAKEAQAIFNRYLASLREGAVNTAGEIKALRESRQRFDETKNSIRNDTASEQKRRWDAAGKYRSEAKTYTKLLTNMGNGLQSDLNRLITPELAGSQGAITTVPEWGQLASIPGAVTLMKMIGIRSQMEAMDKAVMYGLTAIGICMMIGFCNRLACLGGVIFLINVVLTTFPVPGVHPALPSAVGNFMFVSKDVVEMIAMLFLASIPAGRWAGLDYYLYHFGGKKIMKKICPLCACSSETE